MIAPFRAPTAHNSRTSFNRGVQKVTTPLPTIIDPRPARSWWRVDRTRFAQGWRTEAVDPTLQSHHRRSDTKNSLMGSAGGMRSLLHDRSRTQTMD